MGTMQERSSALMRLVLVFALVGLCSCGCFGPQCKATSASSSQATYYTTYVPSSCYGYDTSKFPKGNLIAAASRDVFNNKAACGAIYEITCKGRAGGGSNPCKRNPTVRVKVVDLCPACNPRSFDLSKEAFSRIADLNAGRITISAKRVSN